jgi:hypothetical protein
MDTEFSGITLLRNILCMSTNQNQEHLINCIKNIRQNFLQKSCVFVFQVAEASKMPGPILKSTPHDSVWATKWIKNCSV